MKTTSIYKKMIYCWMRDSGITSELYVSTVLGLDGQLDVRSIYSDKAREVMASRLARKLAKRHPQ